MPTSQGLNTGKDITLVLTGPLGLIQVSGITGFHASQITQGIDSKRLDGDNIYDELPMGWNVSFDYDRTDSSLDDYFAAKEDAYHSAGTTSTATIYQTIVETNGVTQYRFDGCALKFDDAGDWRGDQKVTQKVSGKAGRRVKVA